MNSSSRRRGLAIRASLDDARKQPATVKKHDDEPPQDDSKMAQYEKEIRVLRQEFDTELINNIRLERDLEYTHEELAEIKDEYQFEQERHNEQVNFLVQEFNLQEDDDSDDDDDEYDSDELDDDDDSDEQEANVEEQNHSLSLVSISLSESPAERVGDYLLGKLIGNGTYAKVHKGIHCQTDKEYAIKCIDKSKLGPESNAQQQLSNELMVLQQITHTNMIHAVEIYNASDGNFVYAVTQLGYKDLQDYRHLHKDRMSDESTLQEIMIGTLRALEFMHSIGICHSDIKAENILIMTNSQLTSKHVKLCDFGSCTVSSSKDPRDPVYQYTLKGTLPLLAPEALACSAEKPCDARPVDMWAVGCMLLELTDDFPDSWEDAYEKVRLKDLHGFQQGLEGSLKEIRARDDVLNNSAFDIVCGLLRTEPTHRRTVTRVLLHPWFDGYSKSRSEKSVTKGRESI